MLGAAGLFTALVVLFAWADVRLRPALAAAAEVKAKQLATRAVNDAILATVARDLRYGDLVHLERNQAGLVSYLFFDTGAVTRLQARVVDTVERALEALSETRYDLPLGQVLGSNVLSAHGPQIPIRILLVGSVAARPLTRFEAAGINQVHHSILFDITATVRVVVPFVSQEIPWNTQVVVTDAVILGAVPDVFLNLGARPGETLGIRSWPLPAR